MPVVLLALTGLAYAPAFSAGFLNYDDPWLIQRNPYYAPGAWHTPSAAFFDLSRPTRLAFGAEYLPLRDLSVTHHVPDAAAWSAPAVAGYAFVLGSLALALLRSRHGERLPLFAFVWFFAPLLPVSQVLAPLQNRMADRYAWLSVLAPCLLVAAAYAHAIEHAARRWLRAFLLALGLAALSALTWLTFERSVLFTDGVLLFADAAAKAPDDPKAAYHLGRSLAEAGRDDEAMQAYREALRWSGAVRAR